MVTVGTDGGRLTAQVSWIGLRVGGRLTLSLHSSNEPSELLQWSCHDDSSINIGINSTSIMIGYCIHLFISYRSPTCSQCLDLPSSCGEPVLPSLWPRAGVELPPPSSVVLAEPSAQLRSVQTHHLGRSPVPQQHKYNITTLQTIN